MLKSSSLLEGLPLILMGEVGALGTDNCVVIAGGREEIGSGCLSVKHNPQKVGKDHTLEDEDVIQIVKK